ncbi:vWA domain-containing protein [Streptomyces sp. NPDC001393]
MHQGRTAAQTNTRRMCVDFTGVLRRHGVLVSPAQTLTYYEAILELGDFSLTDLFWAGRAVLAPDVRVQSAYAQAFFEFFAGSGEDLPPAAQPRRDGAPQEDGASSSPSVSLTVDEEATELPAEARGVASTLERLRAKSFAAMTEEERRETDRVIRRMRPKLAHRLSRRRKSARSGPYFDMRRTLRRLLATDGEPTQPGQRRRRIQQRPITIVVDVSGSMTAYAHALLRFCHALLHAGHKVEAFTVGVSLHRVTDVLRPSSADRALEQVGRAVTDWDGGTRLASSLARLLELRKGHSALRGAILVICSDGLDKDDPGLLREVMARLSRMSHHVIWLNPLKADPRYQPLARGMAAALPYVDVFLSGHNIASLEETARVLAGSRLVNTNGGRS